MGILLEPDPEVNKNRPKKSLAKITIIYKKFLSNGMQQKRKRSNIFTNVLLRSCEKMVRSENGTPCATVKAFTILQDQYGETNQ